MDKADIRTLVTEILDGNEIGETLFDALLDVSQALREGYRPWVILRKEDATQSVSAGNTFETEKDLPSDFRNWYTDLPINTTDSQGNVQSRLTEIPIQRKNEYKDAPDKFYCDYAAGKLYICGSFSEARTIRQYYKLKGVLVSADDANEWIFPSEYHKILAFDVAVMYKLGIDYDVINNMQGDNNAAVANRLMDAAVEWDDELARGALIGQNYGAHPSVSQGETTGRISALR